jgi:hypothetical protein
MLTDRPTVPGIRKQSARDTDQFENTSLQKFLSEVGWNILTIRRVFLLLTRVHYSNPNNYGRQAAQFKEFVWNADPEKSTLAIDLDFDFDATKIEKRPAIFVGTDDVLYRKPIVDNSVGLNEDGSGQEYVYIGSTNVIIRHVGKTADESLAMVDLSRNFFKGMRKMMMENGVLSAYEVPRITTSKPFQRSPIQADQQFEADLLISIAFNDAWTIFRESHRITQIDFELNNSIAEFIQSR